MRITFAMLARPPANIAQAPFTACHAGEMLGCAFATWVPLLPQASSDVAILLDCSKPSGAQGTLPVSYTTVVPAAIHSRCLWGGVCERYNNDTRYSLTCARGTIALLDWLNEAFSGTEFVVKVDTDALLLPAQVDSYIRSLASAVALDPKQVVIYAGNALRTYEYRRCEGVRVRGRSYCSSAGKPCGKLVCLRSTVQWQQLEASINPLRVPDLHEMRVSTFWRADSPSASGPKSPHAARAAFMLESLSAANRSKSAVGYGHGGTYVLSRAAVVAMASKQCVRRVSSIQCYGWSSKEPGACEHSPQHEDAAVGLCAHLLGGVHHLTERCFVRYLKEWPICKARLLALHPIKNGSVYLREWQHHRRAAGFTK